MTQNVTSVIKTGPRACTTHVRDERGLSIGGMTKFLIGGRELPLKILKVCTYVGIDPSTILLLGP